jgi:hypothetical protein
MLLDLVLPPPPKLSMVIDWRRREGGWEKE